jgi:hypothetical protein
MTTNTTAQCHRCGTAQDINLDGSGRYVCGACLYLADEPTTIRGGHGPEGASEVVATIAPSVISALHTLVIVAEERVAKAERRLARIAQQGSNGALYAAVADQLRRDRIYLAERESSLDYWRTYRD